jgi:hypothetical protein
MRIVSSKLNLSQFKNVATNSLATPFGLFGANVRVRYRKRLT